MSFWPFAWILIPLAGILLAGFSEWLKFREKTANLGSTTSGLKDTVDTMVHELDEMRDQKAALERRIRNLEAIVTTEAWDKVIDGQPMPRIEIPDPEPTPEQKAEQLARRLSH